MTDEEKFKQWVMLGEELGKSTTLPEWQRGLAGQIARVVREGLAATAGERPSTQQGPTNTELPEEPRFEHDCDACVFLGQFYHEEPTEHGTHYDLYYCSKGNRLHLTVLARFGSRGGEYISGVAFASSIPALGEAKKRAIARGLLRVQ